MKTSCPFCAATISLSRDYIYDGDKITCAACGTSWNVVFQEAIVLKSQTTSEQVLTKYAPMFGLKKKKVGRDKFRWSEEKGERKEMMSIISDCIKCATSQELIDELGRRDLVEIIKVTPNQSVEIAVSEDGKYPYDTMTSGETYIILKCQQ